MKKLLLVLLLIFTFTSISSYTVDKQTVTQEIRSVDGKQSAMLTYDIVTVSNDLHEIHWSVDWQGGTPFLVQIAYWFAKRPNGPGYPLLLINRTSSGGIPLSGISYAYLTTPERDPNWAFVTYGGYACTCETPYGQDAVCDEVQFKTVKRSRK